MSCFMCGARGLSRRHLSSRVASTSLTFLSVCTVVALAVSGCMAGRGGRRSGGTDAGGIDAAEQFEDAARSTVDAGAFDAGFGHVVDDAGPAFDGATDAGDTVVVHFPDSGPRPDGGRRPDAGGIRTDAGGPACTPLGESCTDLARCCGADSCRGYDLTATSYCCREAGNTCTEPTDCCGTMECVGGRCACQSSGETCVTNSDCCPGTTCNAGTCRAPCLPSGSTCSGAGSCCAGLMCSGAVCVAYDSHCADSMYCLDDSECCDGYSCVRGMCQRGSVMSCGTVGESCLSGLFPCCAGLTCSVDTCTVDGCRDVLSPCDASHRCCSGFTCMGGVCRAPASCAGSGELCGGAFGGCCAGFTCTGGRCARSTPTCGSSGATCSASSPCCSGLTCSGGRCAGTTSCGSSGALCSGSSPCCSGLTCSGGRCTTPTGSCDGDFELGMTFNRAGSMIGQRCDMTPIPHNCADGTFITFGDGTCICSAMCSSLGVSVGSSCGGSFVCAGVLSGSGVSAANVCVLPSWNLCTGAPPGPDPGSCAPAGEYCSVNRDCCSNSCNTWDGVCY